jgi:cytochrome oxidase Cu insertion factor (SCO1/SenC/PrrC family)
MSNAQPSKQPPHKKRGQLQALLLMLVVALPMVAAYVVYHTGWGMPEGTVNKGALLTPPLAMAELAPQLQGEPWDLTQEPNRWRFVIPGNATCNKTCRDNLYLTRQVHIRLNDKAERVERIYLLLDNSLSPQLADHLSKQHPKLRVMTAQPATVKQALKGSNVGDNPVAAGRYFLMDQEGYLMLSYTPEHTGGELLKDIKKMLKTSYE